MADPFKLGKYEIQSVLGKGAYFARVEDGKIVEFSSHPDAAGMMVQLGLMPGA